MSGMKFEAGKVYGAHDCGLDRLKVIGRTACYVIIEGGWRMKIRIDSDGNEYVFDHRVPVDCREACKYSAKWVVDAEDL